MKEMPMNWVKIFISAIVPEAAVYGITRAIEAHDENCKVQVRTSDTPATAAPSRRPGGASQGGLPREAAPPPREEAPAREASPAQEKPSKPSAAKKPKAYLCACQGCGRTFQAGGPRAKLCAACKMEANAAGDA